MTAVSTPLFILVTAPSSSMCDIYLKQLEYLKRRLDCINHSNCRLMCLSDPHGTRIGSGGGTLNAIHKLIETVGKEEVMKARVVVVHSGGDSRRCPLKSITGKAWTSINCERNEQSAMALLLTELSVIWNALNPGSLVVASSDVLVNLHSHSDTPVMVDNAVHVIAVREHLHIAQNHGVLGGICKQAGNIKSTTFPANRYLQKPSVANMIDAGVVFGDCDENATTLIDTGIVIATGTAFKALIGLLDDPIVAACTEKGLRSGAAALRLELYSDILHALTLNNSKCGLEEYFHRLGLRQQYVEVLEKGWDSASEYHRALVAIWNVLCDTPLFGVFIEEGVFYHLGTSRELYELQTAPLLAEESLDMRRILPLLRAQYNLVPSISSIHYTTCCTENTCTINNKSDITTHNFGGVISINSSIGLCPCAVLGRGVVIENSVLFGRCNIGNGSVISDIQPTLGYALSVPPDTMIQQVPLLVDRECLGEEFVLIVLGAADNIKECDIENITLCGMKITYMMQCGDLSKSDIWDDDSESSLWTAKLFPVVTCDMVEQYDASELMNILGWFMQGRCDVDSTMTRRAALVWKACRRVALSDLLRMGNAMLLLHWKLFLSALTVNGSSLVTQYNCENSLAPTSPHNRTNDFSTVFRAANDSLLRAVRIIDREMSEVVSLFLALGYLRLCREESYSFADDSAMSCLHDERYLNHLDLHRFRSVLAEYDAMWARVASCGLIPLMNDYFIAMVDFYSPSSVLITVLNRVSTVIVRESQYPRLLLLYERLRSKRVLTGINEGSTCHSSLSRDLFKDNVLQCLEDGRVNIRRALDFMFARIHEYAMKDSVCAVDRDECDPWDIVWMAQVIIRYHLQMSNLCGASFKFAGNVAEVMGNYDRVCVAQSPVRVDLAGGWSDTAPISYEYPGAVLNVAIDIDLKCPLRCACRIIPTAEIKMVSYTVSPLEFAQTGLNTSQFETETSTSVDVNDFDIFNRISRSETSVIPSCVLIKACIVVAKVVDVRLLKSESNTVSFEHFLRDSYGGGIEIATCSLIPSGSGVGGSSILAGVVLQSLIRLLNPSCEITPDILVAMVSQVEQLLTTGGGWQDQVGGIYGGIKMCRSNGDLPMTVAVSPIALPDQLIARLEERMLVIYTGVQRLARNTLINALSTHAVFPLVNMKTSVFNNMSGVVPNLINTAENIDKLMRRYIINYDNSVEEADHVIDLLAAALNSYWEQKKDIANGSETPYMSLILREVSRVCCGVSACGAGAGGFIACILAPEYGKSCMEKVIDDLNASSSHCVLTVHDVRVNNHGVDGSTIDLACKHSIEDALFDHKIDHVV